MSGACSSDGEGRGVYMVLLGKPEGKRLMGRPRRRWEYNIKGPSRNRMWRWTGVNWLGIETGVGHL
jgi:hypothetical protein